MLSAKADLTVIKDAAATLNDPLVTQAAHDFDDSGRELLGALPLAPGGFSSSRKHLTVHLHEIRETSRRFARLNAQDYDPARRKAFIDFMRVVEQSYKSRAASVTSLPNDTLDLKIGVLRDALSKAEAR